MNIVITCFRAGARYKALKLAGNTYYTVCPWFFNPNLKTHRLIHFYNVVIHVTVQNQPKNPSDIGLPKE